MYIYEDHSMNKENFSKKLAIGSIYRDTFFKEISED